MPAKKSEKPAAPPKPAPEKAPASKDEKMVIPPVKPIEKPAAQPVKPVSLPKPAAQPAAMLAKDLGAEKFLAAMLKELADKGSQEDISKIVNTEWAKINTWKVQTAKAYIKGKFSSSVDPKDAIIVGHGDAVKEKVVIGATVYLVKGKAFVNLKLVNKKVYEYEHLSAGRMVSKMNTANYEITPETAESAPISDVDFYTAILNASIPKADVPTHKFAGYEIVAMECKVRSFGADFTNPKATKNDSLMFSFSPLALTEWDITGWVQKRDYGGSYLAFLGSGELAEYSRMTTADKAAFVDSILRDQIVMVVLKLAKEPFSTYQSTKGEFTNLDGEIIALALRPDELDPVVYESRPIRAAKPATSPVDNMISGTTVGNTTYTDIPSGETEQPVGGTPVALPPEVLQRIAEIKAVNGKEDALIQQDAIDIQEANADLEALTLLQALNMLLDSEKEKAAKASAPVLPAPEKSVDYMNPEDDTPALKQFRRLAIKAKSWDIPYDQFLGYAKQYNLKEVTAETLPKELFEAFVAANKGGK